MKNHYSMHSFCFIILYCCASIIFHENISWSADQSYPVKINLITKNQADYKTPENTLAAGFFALMNNDLDWYYETLTKEAAMEDKAMYEEAGIDIIEKYKLVNPGDQLVILDKKAYKNGILIHIKGITSKGTIITGPNVFVLENGLWKETYDYISDEEIHAYFDIAPSEEIFNIDIRLFPEHWNYQWYQQMLNKKSKQPGSGFKKVSVLCVLGNLKDTSGNIHSVEDIDPETLVLNYVVKPTPWHYGQKNKTLILTENNTSNHSPHKSFKNWKKQHRLRPGFEGPVMLVKFSKFEAISSLDNLDDNKTHTISVSGKLKDNETHFRGETQITLTPPSSPGKQDKTPAFPAVENLFHNHWWDQ
jgi:hypothetical protein